MPPKTGIREWSLPSITVSWGQVVQLCPLVDSESRNGSHPLQVMLPWDRQNTFMILVKPISDTLEVRICTLGLVQGFDGDA